MLWVCRAGKEAKYESLFRSTSRIYLAWEGFDKDLLSFNDKEAKRKWIMETTSSHASTSISNWMSQIDYFASTMQIGDYVVVPGKCSRVYSLVQITGNYEYNASAPMRLFHSRKVRFIVKDIPRSVFAQEEVFSLGAFRTVFKVRLETEVLSRFRKECKANRGLLNNGRTEF